jgi:hypothetical protein
MRPVLLSIVVSSILVQAACDGSLTACGEESDISGELTISATPLPGDFGAPALPESFTIDAQLDQAGKTDFFSIGRYVYGTLTASDPNVFGTISIPMLVHNDGPKTGVVRGCTIQLNVPIDMPVTDDNGDDMGPVRVRLSGNVTGKGTMVGEDPTSQEPSVVALVSDASNMARPFAWTAVQK